MREIKFRAWNAGNNEWLSCGDIAIFSGGALSAFGNSPLSTEDFPKYYPLITLMQFTGLLDKYGVEIYEGDILSGHDDGLVKVEWRTTDLSTGWQCLFADDVSIGLDEMCLWFGNCAEVIGNIYQNPELLDV